MTVSHDDVTELARLELELDVLLDEATIADTSELESLAAIGAALWDRIVALRARLSLPDPEPRAGWEARSLERFRRTGRR